MSALFEITELKLELRGRLVLRDITFAVKPAEKVVLLGVNGCGKTTLLKCLDGLLTSTGGQITYAGALLTSKKLFEPEFRLRFRGEVALLFQNVDAMLFNPTVGDEIAFGPRQLNLSAVEERVKRWAHKFQIEDLLERPPFELSGGEKKRVALAAILAIDPKVLLLDEPTGNLDPASAARLVDFLGELHGTTIIVSTHNLSVMEELGDRALLLAPGHPGLLYDGSSAALATNDKLLVAAGLAHKHSHRHTASEHVHFHIHEPD